MAGTKPQADRSSNTPIKNIRELIERFEESGDLVRVKRPVDRENELAAVLKRVQTELKKAVLFENVKGSDFAVVGNLYGGRDKLATIFGVPEKEGSRRTPTWRKVQWARFSNTTARSHLNLFLK